MPGIFAFCRCVGEAVLAKGARGLAGLVPFGDHLYDIAANALKRWRELKQTEDKQQALRREFEEAAQEKLQDFEQDMRRIVAEVAVDQHAQVQEALTGYLSLIPDRIRQTFSRPDDPSGRSAPPAWLIERPEDLLVFLPPRPPRFKAGDCPPNSKYVLTERLGAGGFGEVWKARHTLIKNRFAAFKFCLDPAARGDLLKHEARIISQVMNQVDHPGIVKLQDVDYNPEAPWLQFEFVPGGDLAELVSNWANDPARRVPLATKMIQTLARTVGYCHQLDPPVVHRDLKPTNVLVAPSADGKGRLKISDFGISGLVAVQALDEANRLTRGSPSMPTLLRYAATPLYASPQQKAGAKPDPRDDVHALGVMWYQLLLGNCLQPLGSDWRDDLAELGIHVDLIKLLAKCVASKTERRPKNAAELAELIEDLSAELTVATPLAQPTKQREKLPANAPLVSFEDYPKSEREPGEVITNILGMKFAWIPPGNFMMGSPEEEDEREDDEIQHKVTLTKGFYMGIYTVTQEQWKAVMGNNPSEFKGEKDLPVETVSWIDCQEFIKKLREKDKKPYRLPTEAEWEYACRGGTPTPFHFGESISTDQANYYGEKTTPVGIFPANDWGLHDMHGNVWEWCLDEPRTYTPNPVDDPRGPETAWGDRVLRGGCWRDEGFLCRAARRDPSSTLRRHCTVGFRVVLVR